MKERGILFTPENYAKSENGSKVQTRRILKTQPGPFVHIEHDDRRGWHYWWDACHSPGDPDVWQEYAPLKCPYGQPGDRLYVKEGLALDVGGIKYRRDGAQIVKPVMGVRYGWRWKTDTLSPLFMPKWAARLWLELTAVRVERLQDCSEADALAEGVTIRPDAEIAARVANDTPARMEYWALWESINGKGSWDENPFVWVLSFVKVNP